MKQRKCLLALLMATALLVVPVRAAKEEPVPQRIDDWASDGLVEATALGMWLDDYYYCIQDQVTDTQLEHVTQAVAGKLALLDLPVREQAAEPLVLDGTRGSVMEALYREAAEYQLPGLEQGAASYLSALGVVQGDGTDYHLDRSCTLQETLIMAQRLVLAVYDSQDAGSRGLLWKATNGSNTLYLLGTIHVDRGNVYPFHKSLRDAITGSQNVIFEIDFGDTEDLQRFSAMQFYTEDATLKDHVNEELYNRAVEAGLKLGLLEDQVAAFKPWALANLLQSTALSQTGSAGSSQAEVPVLIDTYVYSKAVNNNINVDAVESAVYQGQIFDSLSPDYQRSFLDMILQMYYETDGSASEENHDPAGQIDAMLDTWKDRDPAAFDEVYEKEAMLNSGDEMTVKLFTERDPGMLSYAVTYLQQEGGHTGILVVGAGHMVGKTGIVQGLIDQGYTVEVAE